ncbi:STAS/SEC14 domain-containing protein [Maridesulfovibrio sp.]|uniref:STAS/SEC14 domain-containing protein n=1 Tax=Maridesulfovibrio sp. TaxID=2795000 RepID=UPI0029F45889|nr:STAS/SEC14 domain-containing protein [Maridesulfovibrio sp.]
MLELIDVGPNVLGLKIQGKIQNEDIQEVIKTSEDKLENYEQIAIYIEIIEMGGISIDAFFTDLKFALPNLKKFSKKAVVSESKWHDKLAKIIDKIFSSIEIRHFTPEERENAKKWVLE